MKEYEEIKVPVTCSIPLGLLKDFDEVIKKKTVKKGNRSYIIAKLMQVYVDKEKNLNKKI